MDLYKTNADWALSQRPRISKRGFKYYREAGEMEGRSVPLTDRASYTEILKLTRRARWCCIWARSILLKQRGLKMGSRASNKYQSKYVDTDLSIHNLGKA